MNLCKYKDLFGKPEERTLRDPIFGLALIDMGVVLMSCYGVSKLLNFSFLIVFFIVMVISVIAHRAFCVRTAVDKFLFP